MAPHERGQVAHVLRTAEGARLFSQAGSTVHPEWICVLDARVRSKKRIRDMWAILNEFDPNGVPNFDPQLAYGLDDDWISISDEVHRWGMDNGNLLDWRSGDENPPGSHNLAGRQANGFEAVPNRLRHLIDWIGDNVHSPVLAWWAVRQNGLHPRLLHCIDRRISLNGDLHDVARHVWSLILEHDRGRHSRQSDHGWRHLRKRIAAEGWTVGVLRDFRRLSRLRLEIQPPTGSRGSRPPTADWDVIEPGEVVGSVDVSFHEPHKDLEVPLADLEVPDSALVQVFRVLEDQLSAASGLLSDVGTVHFTTPTCYPAYEDEEDAQHSDDAKVMKLFVKLFNRIAETRPELARAHALIWLETDGFYFRKLRLYGLSRKRLFGAEHVAEAVLSLDQVSFWDFDVRRELLFLLADRWEDFAPDDKVRLTERILEGPSKHPHWSADEYRQICNQRSALYGRYLELQGCALKRDHSERLSRVISNVPDWNDGWAASICIERRPRVGLGGGADEWEKQYAFMKDETPDVLVDLPVKAIVARAKNVFLRMPFTGLVKEKPQKALDALIWWGGEKGEYPQAFWSTMIDDLPDDVPPGLKQEFLHGLMQLPDDAVADLQRPLGSLLKRKFASIIEFDEDLAWSVYDRIVDGILAALDPERRRMPVLHSGLPDPEPTFEFAMASPVGMCAEAFLEAIREETREAGTFVPDHVRIRLERLLSAPGDSFHHAVAVLMRRLNRLMQVVPEWTEERLIPVLTFDHPASNSAWNGFLHEDRPPSEDLAVLVKPLLLRIHPLTDGFALKRELSEVADQWLGHMHIFRPDGPDGLTQREMRNVLRSMSDDARSRFIFWLGDVGKKDDDGWIRHVIPFVKEVWPRELRFRTSLSVRSWLGLLDQTGDSFPAVYCAVSKFLAPVELGHDSFRRFTGEMDEDEPIATAFPNETLDLMDRMTDGLLTLPPLKLRRILELIVKADQSLASDLRYLRLIDLVERS